MIEFYLTKEELQKALACLEQLEERGFVASQACFGLKRVGDLYAEESEFKDQLIMRAHPTDPNQNWGRISTKMISWHRLVDGRVVDE